MKIKLILIGIIVCLIGAISIQQVRINHIQDAKNRYQRNMDAALTECVTWKTKDSLSAAQNGILTFRISELERYKAEDLKTINALKKKNEDLNNLIKNNTKTEIKIITHVRDSIIYRDTAKVFSWKDKWVSVAGIVYKDTAKVNVASRDSLVISATTQYKRFLGFLWKTKKIKDQNVYVISKNPHTTIANIEYYGINK